MKIKALIIDDEEPARNLIKNYLQDNDTIEIIGECADGFSAARAINELKPGLVFLDIQLPKLTGFEILELIEHRPVIIFATAYDQYAIKAFEANATDYLLKPFSKDRFNQALTKAMDSLALLGSAAQKLEPLMESIAEQPEILNRIAVKSGSNIHVIPVDELIWLEAEGDYVLMHTQGHRYMKEKTMKFFEQHLDPKQFVRIHRSCIVNINFIARIELYDKYNYMVLLKDQTKVKASSEGYRLLKNVLNL